MPRLHVANWRQITVAIVKTKFASQIECFDPDDGDEDAEEMDPIIRSMTDQRNHKTRTVNRAYADPKVFNPPLVGWIQTPIQIRFRGGQTQVRWIQGRVDSENIARYSHTWKRWIATTNCKIIDIANNFIGAILVKLCAMEA